MAEPSDDEREDCEPDRLPCLEREHCGIDEVEIGLHEIKRDHQREAGEPYDIGFPAEPADLRLAVGRHVHFARDAEKAIVRRAPDVLTSPRFILRSPRSGRLEGCLHLPMLRDGAARLLSMKVS